MSRSLSTVGSVARVCRPSIQPNVTKAIFASTEPHRYAPTSLRHYPHQRATIQYYQCRMFSASLSRFDDEADTEKTSSRRRGRDGKGSTTDEPRSIQGIKMPDLTKKELDAEMQEIEGIDDIMKAVPQQPEIEEERWEREEEGFFNLDEVDSPGEDEEFAGDDISSPAHEELEYVREMRQLIRVCAWDMPLLWAHAKPFTPPTEAQPLRFRYTTYLGEHHPAARKVVVTFTPSQLDKSLTQIQVDKIIKLLGPRYNPSRDLAKISCEMYPTLPQNKRWLGDMVEKILAEVKDPTKDTFEDIPFDFRYHTFEKKVEFPEEWKLNDEKRAALVSSRNQIKLLESQKMESNLLIDGTKVADDAMRAAAEMEGQPVPVPVGRQAARSR